MGLWSLLGSKIKLDGKARLKCWVPFFRVASCIRIIFYVCGFITFFFLFCLPFLNDSVMWSSWRALTIRVTLANARTSSLFLKTLCLQFYSRLVWHSGKGGFMSPVIVIDGPHPPWLLVQPPLFARLQALAVKFITFCLYLFLLLL